jgi:subtilisin-like proprotein convertase family protein
MIKLSISAAPHNQLMKSAVMAAVMLSSAGVVLGQTTTNLSFTVNQNIPQGDPSGFANTQTLNFSSVPDFSSIVNLTVTLDISGGFNGGYYAYLVNNSGGFAILLNRPGTTAGNSLGYADSGFNITLSGSSPNDIHTYQSVSNPGGGALTGTWAPDGRNVDPATVVDTDARTALLSSFAGTDPSGQWTLFLANLDYGEQGELVSWGLSITAVPEPSSVGLALLGLGIFLGVRRLVRRRA